MEYVIDAKGKPLGRIASEAAIILQGKKNPTYDPRLSGTDHVIIKNAGDVVVTGKKAEQKVYYRHSTRIGSLKKRTYAQAFERDPAWVIRRAVRLMLPKNKLQKDRLQRLIIET